MAAIPARAEPPAGNPVSIDRGLQRALSEAKSLIARGQEIEAFRTLEPLLISPTDNVAFVDGRYIDAKLEASRLFGGMSSKALAAYEKEFGAIARQELERAKASGRVEPLLRVANSYRHTEAGRQALSSVAGLLFDRGRFIEAAAACRELLDVAGPAIQQQKVVAPWLVMSWLRLGQTERARLWIDARRERLAHTEIEYGGVRQPLDRWLDQLLTRQRATSIGQAARIAGGHSQSDGLGPVRRPTVQSAVIKQLSGPGVSTSAVDEALSRLVETGVPPLSHSIPLVVGDTVLVRRIDELAAFDVHTGELRWSHNLSASRGGFFENPNGYPQMPSPVDIFLDRALAGGAHTAITSDGPRVYTVVEDVVAAPSDMSFGRRGRRMIVESPPRNSLACYAVEDGKQHWRISDLALPDLAAAGEDTTRDVDFLGPPLPVGDTLYVLGRTDDGPLLLALAPADGSVRWTLNLAGFSGFEADVASAYGVACVPIEADGLLVCATPAGTVVAIDLVRRTCRWVFRAPTVDEPMRVPPRWGRGFAPIEAAWLSGWREATIRCDGERCFVVVPRSPAVHALALDTGKPIWTQPVAAGLFLGPLVDNRLIAVGRFSAVGVDAANGKRLWESPMGLPSGRGFVANGRYLLPQANGGLARIDIQTGAAVFEPQAEAPRLGNIVSIGQIDAEFVAVSASQTQLARLLSLDWAIDRAAAKVSEHPKDLDAINRHARLEGEADEFPAAERRLQAMVDSHVPGSRAVLFQTLLADAERHVGRADEIAPQLESLAEGDRELATALRTTAIAYRRNGQPLRALEALLKLSAIELPSDVEADRGPSRTVSFERSIRGDIEDLLQSVPPAERKAFDTRVEQFVTLCVDQADLEIMRRVLVRVPVSLIPRTQRQEMEVALRPEPGFLRSHLDLLNGASSADGQAAADAWRGLAELYRSQGDKTSAAACYHRLQSEFKTARFEDGRTPADLVAAIKNDRALSKEFTELRSDRWPKTVPELKTDTQGGTSSRFAPLPLEIVPGSLGERLDVALDHDGATLRFQSDEHPAYWDLNLPPESSPYRSMSMLHRGWSLGRVLVVQAGTDLIGVAPLDDAGEAVGKVLWSLDLLGADWPKGNDLSGRFGPGGPGFRGAGFGPVRVTVADRLGRPAARVGPVLPGCVCYYDRGALIALDPLTGRRLWRRSGMVPPDLASGDDRILVLVNRHSKRLDFLRAVDGKQVGGRPADKLASELRWLEGRDGVIQVAEPQTVRLSRCDLMSGRTIWSRTFPPGTQFVRLDDRLYAGLGPDGTWEVLSASDGSRRVVEHIPKDKRDLQIYATRDERRFFVAFSGPFDDQENFRANTMRDDSRSPLVNGSICALDRESGKMLWSRRFEDGIFSLDQSKIAPVLVFSYRHGTPGDEGGFARPTLHCIDKRTGRDVYLDRFDSQQSFLSVFPEANLDRREVLLRLPESEIRFRFPR